MGSGRRKLEGMRKCVKKIKIERAGGNQDSEELGCEGAGVRWKVGMFHEHDMPVGAKHSVCQKGT